MPQTDKNSHWRVDHKEKKKSSEASGKGVSMKKQFEIMRKINDLESTTIKKIVDLQSEINTIQQESKGLNHQMNRLMVEIQNKGIATVNYFFRNQF